MTVSNTIYEKLSKVLSPCTLEIIDESHKHKGHGGWRADGETHFKIIISSPKLTGSRILQHKTIMNLLKNEMQNQIHALSIEIQ